MNQAEPTKRLPARLPGLLPDLALITAVVLLSLVLYAGSLGFYSDDWAIIAYLRSGDEHTLGEILRRGLEWLVFRPGQAVYLGILYWIFGLEPLGYHFANAFVLIADAGLLYIVLRECDNPRLVALAIALTFILLPHYATVRFWFAAFAGPVAMAAFLISVYAELRVLEPGRLSPVAWKGIALLGLIASLATYETYLPLFVAVPLLIWYRNRPAAGPDRTSPRWLAGAFVLNALIIVGIALIKMQSDYRYRSATVVEHLTAFATLIRDAADTALAGDFGLRLPWTLLTIAREHADPLVFAGALLTGMIVFAGLWRIARQPANELPGPGGMLRLSGMGVLFFLAGYGIFLTNFSVAITTTGSNNRTGMAAAIGIAMLLVGVPGWLAGFLPAGRRRTGFFCAVLAAAAASSFLIINTVAKSWVTAAARQAEVLADIKLQIPALSSGTTLLLDGVCPYAGPAPVFEAWWDVGGALQITYDDASLRGDIVDPTLQIRPEGLYTWKYEGTNGPYPYRKLFVYDVARRERHALAGPLSARAYFRTHNPTGLGTCRPTREGFGEPLFGPGRSSADRVRE